VQFTLHKIHCTRHGVYGHDNDGTIRMLHALMQFMLRYQKLNGKLIFLQI